MVVDPTGLKVSGEGDSKVRQHGYCGRRTGRKIHWGVDADTHEIAAVLVTTNSVGDGEVLPTLLDQVNDPIAQLSADGAYDSHGCYQASRRGGPSRHPAAGRCRARARDRRDPLRGRAQRRARNHRKPRAHDLETRWRPNPTQEARGFPAQNRLVSCSVVALGSK